MIRTFGGLFFAAGILFLSRFIDGKTPRPREAGRPLPVQEILGLPLLIWGTWGVITVIRCRGLLSLWPAYWINMAVAHLLTTGGGALLSGGRLWRKLGSGASPEAQESGTKMRRARGWLGLACLLWSLWIILLSPLFFKR